MNYDIKELIDINKHTTISKDSCIYAIITKDSSEQESSLYNYKIMGNFVSVSSNHEEGEYYAHIYNTTYSNFPIGVTSIIIDTYDTYIHDLCLGVVLGISSAIDNYALDNNIILYVFITKNFNSKLELKNIIIKEYSSMVKPEASNFKFSVRI
jgi:hypothetical protein